MGATACGPDLECMHLLYGPQQYDDGKQDAQHSTAHKTSASVAEDRKRAAARANKSLRRAGAIDLELSATARPG